MRFGPIALALALTFGAALDASAGPDPAKLRAAADSFEAGAKSYKDGKHEEAAAHFEAADSAVPSSKALRFAIRARSEAGQASRAATLAALALERYPDDAETKKLATETVEKLGPTLHRAEVSCASPCLLAVGPRIVHGEAATRWTVYLDAGKQSVGASFLGKIAAPEQSVDAEPGGTSKVRFVPPAGQKPPPETPPEGGGGEGGATGGTGEDPPPDEPKSDWRIHPAPFIVGLIATAGLGATTIWSGIDTINNPGEDAVREGCRGQGEDCELYQEGQSKELRTNALIGATAGVAAVTVVLAIVTDWDGDDEPEKDASSSPWKRGPLPLWVEVGSAMAQPGGSQVERVTMGYRGRF
jgi:hypothetical protein